MPISWHVFFGYNSVIYGPIRRLHYKLVLRNSSYSAYFSFVNLWAAFDLKMGVATTHASNGLGLPKSKPNQ